MEKIFDFIKSALDYVDNGSFFRQPFKWLYYILGIANIYIPIKLIMMMSEYSRYLDGKMSACLVILIILSIPIAFFACMIWINRGNALTDKANQGARFVAIPIVANFIQTSGEWMGFLIGVMGLVISLLTLIFASDELYYILPGEKGAFWILVWPITGYLMVVFARFISESCLALASIANRTQSIDKEVKKIADK